jgi:hypothetical protein
MPDPTSQSARSSPPTVTEAHMHLPHDNASAPASSHHMNAGTEAKATSPTLEDVNDTTIQGFLNILSI